MKNDNIKMNKVGIAKQIELSFVCLFYLSAMNAFIMSIYMHTSYNDLTIIDLLKVVSSILFNSLALQFAVIMTAIAIVAQLPKEHYLGEKSKFYTLLSINSFKAKKYIVFGLIIVYLGAIVGLEEKWINMAIKKDIDLPKKFYIIVLILMGAVFIFSLTSLWGCGKMWNYILLFIYGPQYNIKKEINKIIKSSKLKKCDMQNIISKINEIYKNDYSLDELFSRKYHLEHISNINNYILIPIAVSIFGTIITNLLLEIMKLMPGCSWERDFFIVRNFIKGIIIIFLIVTTAMILIAVYMYLSLYVPRKNKSKVNYLRQIELNIIKKQINRKLK